MRFIRNLNSGISALTLGVLCGACIYGFTAISPTGLCSNGLATGVTIALAALLARYYPRHSSKLPDAYRTVSAALLIGISLLITNRAAALLPGLVNRQTVFAVHLGPVFYVLHYLVTFSVTWAAFSRGPGGLLAPAGLVAILVHGLCNGEFFFIQGERFGLLYGLTVTTLMIHIRERKEQSFTPRLPGMLAVPILVFFGWALISSVTSIYVHASFEQLMRLGNWVLSFFLVVWIVRDRDQVEHLVTLLFLMAALVAGAGLWGVAGYAFRAGLHEALRARLSVADLHGNAVATFLAAYVTLGCGMLVARHHRLRGVLLPILLIIAAVSGGLGYVTRAGWENPLKPYLSPEQMDLVWGICLSASVAAVITLAVFLWKGFRGDSVGMALIASMMLALFLTYSRSGAVGLLTGLISLLVLTRSFRDPSRRSAMPQVGSRAGALIFLLLLAVPTVLIIGTTAVRTTPDELHVRLNIWKVVLNTIRHHPIVGVGLNNHFLARYSDILPLEFGAGLAHPSSDAIQNLVTSARRIGWHAHNILLETAQAMGVIGLMLLIWLLAAIVRFTRFLLRGATSSTTFYLTGALFCALVALLVPHLLVLTLSRSTLLPFSFWVFLGLLASLWNTGLREEPRAERSKGPTPMDSIAGAQGKGTFTELALRVALLSTVILVVAKTVVADAVVQRIDQAQTHEDVKKEREMVHLLARLQPWNAELLAEQAGFLDPEERIHQYWRAIRLRPLHAPYRWQLGWSYWARGQLANAHSAFRHAIELDPYEIDGGHYRHDLGLAIAASGHEDEAIEAFAEAVWLDPKTLRKPDWGPGPRGIGLNPAYTTASDTDEPSPQLAGCIEWHLNERSSDCSFRGKPSILIRDVMNRCLEQIDSSTEREQSIFLLKRLVELLNQWGMHEELDEVLDRMELLFEEETRESAYVASQRTDAYDEQGELTMALRATRRALQRHDSPMLRMKLGSILLKTGKTDDAVAELERAAEAWDPSVLSSGSWTPIWLQLGMAYEAARRPSDALRAYDMAQFLQLPVPHYMYCRLSVGRLLHATGAYRKEHKLYRETLRLLQRWKAAHAAKTRIIGMLARQSARCCRETGSADDSLCAPWKHSKNDNPVWKQYTRFYRKETRRVQKPT
jgi:tetratricopeptide (TPR) repeat protein